MSSTLPEVVRDSVDLIAERLVGSGSRAISVIGQRDDYYVLRVEAGRQRVILKLAGRASNEPKFQVGAAPQRLIAEKTSVPVAAVLAADDSYSIVPYRFSVQSVVEGEPWAARSKRLEATQLEEAQRRLGEVIAELHSLAVPGYGVFDVDGTVPSPQALFPALIQHATQIIRQPRLLDTFAMVLTENEADFTISPRSGVAHEDLHGYNILFDLVDATRVSAVLDFDKAWAGPVESDLARLELWSGMTSTAFQDAYRSRVPVDDGYEIRRPLYQLLWCYESAFESADHIALTNLLHNRLGMKPIDTFTTS